MLSKDFPIRRFLLPEAGLQYSDRGKVDNGMLSNFYMLPQSATYRGIRMKTVENLYMALKNPQAQIEVPYEDGKRLSSYIHEIGAASPGKAKLLSYKIPLRENWNTIEIAAMEFAMSFKYCGDNVASDWLLQQDPRSLIEWNNWGDQKYGVEVTDDRDFGEGRNILGLLTALYQRRLQNGKFVRIADESLWAERQNNLLAELGELADELFGIIPPPPQSSFDF